MLTGIKKFLNFLFVLYLLSITNNSLAQGKQGPQNVTPDLDLSVISPSPTAAGFLQHGLIPVTLYTGKPNVTIPVYEIQEGSISTSISLSYNYNGLRPQEEAGWAGLGWNLWAGGVVTINEKGSRDGSKTLAGRNYDGHNPFDSISSHGYLQSITDSKMYDPEADIYNYSFGGYTGRFFFYKGKTITMPYQKMDVTRIDNGNDPTIRIITPEGLIYWFRDIERTTVLSQGTTHARGSTTISLMLSEIISADKKDTLKFNYTTVRTIANSSGFTETITRTENGPPHYNGNESFQTIVTEARGALTGCRQLSTIEGKTVKLVFTTQPQPRLDLGIWGSTTSEASALREINIYSKQNGADIKIKGYRFDVEYFSENTSTNSQKLRLKLKKIHQLDALGNTIKSHEFEYEAEFEDFPNKNTKDIDEWGYYNNAGNISLIPQQVSLSYLGYSGIGSNRNPDGTYSKYGILKKIKFPTGGYSTFDYEANTYPAQSSNFIGDGTSLNVVSSEVGAIKETGGVFMKQGSFTIPFSQLVSIKWLITFSVTCNPTSERISSPRIVTIKNSMGEIVFESHRPQNSCQNEFENEIYLLPGSYQLQVRCGVTSNKSEVYVDWIKSANGQIENVAGPGLRIKYISSYSDPEKLAFKKEYQYNLTGGVSSGNPSSYGSYKTIEYLEDQCNACATPLVRFTSVSATPGSSYNGPIDNAFVYSFVRELSKSDNGDLVSDYFFDNSSTEMYQDLLTGISLIKKIDYKNTNGNLTAVAIEEFDYDIYEDGSFVGVIPMLTYKKPSLCPCGLGFSYTCTDPNAYADENNRCRFFIGETYFFSANWKYLRSKEERIFGENGLWLKKQTDYEYNLVTRNLTKEISFSNDGNELIVKYKYPEDYISAITGYLLTAKITSPVIEMQQWLKKGSVEKLLQGKITEYDPASFRPLIDYYLQITIPGAVVDNEFKDANGKYTSLLSDSRYQKRIERTYDIENNLSSEKKSNDFKHSYIWGYNNSYPVAEIMNANADQVAYTSFETETTFSGINTTYIQSSGGITGDKYYNQSNFSIVKSGLASTIKYIISYWSKNGAYSITGTQSGYPKLLNSISHGSNTWTLYEHLVTGQSTITISGNGAIDELRLYPQASFMKTYAYAPLVGITAESDVNNRISFYEYDPIGRLKCIRDSDRNILKAYEYKYASQ